MPFVGLPHALLSFLLFSSLPFSIGDTLCICTLLFHTYSTLSSISLVSFFAFLILLHISLLCLLILQIYFGVLVFPFLSPLSYSISIWQRELNRVPIRFSILLIQLLYSLCTTFPCLSCDLLYDVMWCCDFLSCDYDTCNITLSHAPFCIVSPR